jgi:oligosaccharide reducing-end xylanase
LAIIFGVIGITKSIFPVCDASNIVFFYRSMSKSCLVMALIFSAAMGVIAPLTQAAESAAPIAYDNGKGAFATGKYRNLFSEIGKSDAEIKAKVNKAYHQLFEGDLKTQRLFIPAGTNANGPLGYIPDIQHTDVRSEGMSYGMMIAVQMNKKEVFDALWNWSHTYMYHADTNHPTYGYFSWQMNYDGTAISEGAAPDGEEYYAMSLLFAANRWGSGKGIYDYKGMAHKILTDMVHRQSGGSGRMNSAGRKIPSPRIPADPYELGTVYVQMSDYTPDTNAPQGGRRGGMGGFGGFGRGGTNQFGTNVPGGRRGGFGGFGGMGGDGAAPRMNNMVSLEHKMIRFVAGANYTDPSYHLPAFYELWSRWGPAEDSQLWYEAAQVSRDLYVKSANPVTGLCPNYSTWEGAPSGGGSTFMEDAWRCSMNWSVDWLWFQKDPRQQVLSDNIQKFFESKGQNYDDHWVLDGSQSRRNRHSPGLVATLGAASLAASDAERSKKFAEDLWNLDVPSSLVFRYYDGLLYMMCMLNASGQFQAIMPQH